MKFNKHVKKIMKLFSVMILVFTLSSCSAIFSVINGSELENRVNAFNDSSNQFEMETTIDLEVTYLDQTETFNESMFMKIQVEPFYTEMTIGDTTVSQFVFEDRIREIIVDHRNQNDEITLYQEVIYENDLDVSDSMIMYNFNGSSIKKEGDNQYVVEALFKDFLSQSDRKTFMDALSGTGVDEDELLDSSVKVTFTFEADHLIVSIGIKLDINDVLIDMKLTLDMVPKAFNVIDVDNQEKFQKIFTTSDESMAINLNEDVYYPSVLESHMEYYTIYLEPGVYGFDYNGNYEDVFIQMYKTGDQTYMKPLFDFVSNYESNLQLETLYEVKTPGYYKVSLHSNHINYLTKFRIIKCLDGAPSIETADIVITESGSYTYELDHKMDIFSVYLDLPNETLVSINDINSDTAMIIYSDNFDNRVYSSIYHITKTDTSFYINEHNKLIHLYHINGNLSDEINVKIKSLDQVTSMDDPNINTMTTVFSEGYFHSNHQIQTQYMKLEVLEAADYMFSYQVYEGFDVNGKLYDENGVLIIDQLSNIGEYSNYRYFLLPGTYYYATSNTYTAVYRIKYTKFIPNIVNHETIELSGYHEITRVYDENRFFEGVQSSKYQRNLYQVVLDSDQYIVHSSHIIIDIFDSENKKVDFISNNLEDDLVTTFLKSGTYTISVKIKLYRPESYYPFNYAFVFYSLTGITTDDSVNPNYQLLNINTQGTRVSNYLNDIDGFKIVITERNSYLFTSTTDFTLILNNSTYDSRLGSESLIHLEPGIYHVVNYEGYTGTWFFSYKQANY